MNKFRVDIRLWACLFLILLLFSASVAHATYLTSPLSSYQVTSFFDHDYPGGSANNNFIRYDGVQWVDGSATLTYPCSNGVNCYDGHNGIDLVASLNTNVLASAPGYVQSLSYDTCNGNVLRLWHASVGYSTIYAHALPPFVAANTFVNRSDVIATSGGLGIICSTGAHLHFGVRDAQTGGNPIDPYGWQGSGPDPWSSNQPYGYLWTTYPAPSSVVPSSSISVITGTISQSATWVSNNVYVIVGTVTVPSGVTLTVSPGTIVKFADTYSWLRVFGTLDVQGNPQDKAYFTSLADDTVGGDSNGDGGATIPNAADYVGISFYGGSNGNFSSAVFRYAGAGSFDPVVSTILKGAIRVIGGVVSVTGSELVQNWMGIVQDPSIPGSLTVTSSTIHDNLITGIESFILGGTNGSVSIMNSSFGGHTFSDVTVSGLVPFVNAENTILPGSYPAGFYISGAIAVDQTWLPGIPYTVDGITLLAGKTLTIQPGAVVKFLQDGWMVVYGALNAQGGSDPASKIYFTSYRDDAIGGDLYGNGSATVPAPGDFQSIQFKTGSTGSLSNAVIRYGGNETTSGNPSYGVFKLSGINVNVNIQNAEMQSNTAGMGQTSAPFSGSVLVNNSVVANNSLYGIKIGAATTSTVTVTNTFFGGHANFDASIGSNVNFVHSGNAVLPGATSRGIWMSGALPSVNQTWIPELPYVVSSTLSIPPGTTLAIQPGTVVKFSSSASISVQGSLVANGATPGGSTGKSGAQTQGAPPNISAQNEIYFTSFADDSVGGDTNGDGTATVPAPGDYQGMWFNTGSTGTFNNTTIRYGGFCCSYSSGVIRLFGGNVGITHTRIQNNASGINRWGGSISVSQSSIHNNIQYGMQGGSSNPFALAQENWWGSSSGPYHPIVNSGGTGNQILGNVVFAPWLQTDPN